MRQQLLMAAIGICGGVLVSSGVFTVLLSVGLVPRFAGKTNTAHKIFLYEEMIVLGTLFGNVCSVFPNFGHVGRFVRENFLFGAGTAQVWNLASLIFLLVFGLFAGVFVGCLALAIAEMLDSIPILTRRIGFRHGLGCMVLAVAIGKLVGSLFYFSQHFFETGL